MQNQNMELMHETLQLCLNASFQRQMLHTPIIVYIFLKWVFVSYKKKKGRHMFPIYKIIGKLCIYNHITAYQTIISLHIVVIYFYFFLKIKTGTHIYLLILHAKKKIFFLHMIIFIHVPQQGERWQKI